jgi:hypothetical protein
VAQSINDINSSFFNLELENKIEFIEYYKEKLSPEATQANPTFVDRIKRISISTLTEEIIRWIFDYLEDFAYHDTDAGGPDTHDESHDTDACGPDTHDESHDTDACGSDTHDESHDTDACGSDTHDESHDTHDDHHDTDAGGPDVDEQRGPSVHGGRRQGGRGGRSQQELEQRRRRRQELEQRRRERFFQQAQQIYGIPAEMQRRIVQEVPQKYQHELLEELDRYTRIVNERIRILLNLSPERLTQVLQQLTPEDRRQVMEDIYRHQRILEDERRRNQQRR